ncbi:MAG: response regulator transcription factor [Gammaproteobacteria bacterium]|nr:response regulator transcription factor [Gammaproteobacteria bacterium]
MNILITDDEYLARNRVQRLLLEIDPNHTVFEAENGVDAIKQCTNNNIDLIFMDIRMPDMDGLEAAWHLSKTETPPAIIFVTAYDDYALKAFSVNAIDYLLKPVKRENLIKAIEKAGKLNQTQLSKLNTKESNLGQRQHISTKLRGEIHLIPIRDIYFFQADQKYVNVCHKNGEALIEEPLKQLEQEFSDQFVRVHRSALVNKRIIEGLVKDKSGQLLMTLKETDHKLEVSRRHAPDIRKLIKSL